MKEADYLAEVVQSVAVLNGHVPVAEHSQWRRFWRLKELLEKTVASVPYRTMTLGALPSHTELNKMESTMASHIATHEQFPSVHRDQVADKPLRLCLSHGHYSLQH